MDGRSGDGWRKLGGSLSVAERLPPRLLASLPITAIISLFQVIF